MIKFKCDRNKPLIGLGLTDLNLRKMRAGNAIYVHRKELKVDYDIMVFYGETEKQIIENLKGLGMVDTFTKIREGAAVDIFQMEEKK